jgi:hypothetical protein
VFHESHPSLTKLTDLLDTRADRLQAIGMPWEAQFSQERFWSPVIDRMTWPIVVGITLTFMAA